MPSDAAVSWRGHDFRVIGHPAVAAALQEFRSDFEAGTLAFFDAALPFCDSFIDVGAYVGLMSLYCADRVGRVCAFEASPGNFSLLSRNIAANPAALGRITLHAHGLGDRDEHVPLFNKGETDSGSSIFQAVERGRVVNGRPEAMVTLRNADPALRAAGISDRTLLKIDIEGAEYRVVPAIAALLAEAKPFLHLSFHPFNLAAGADEYLKAVVRLRCALQVAEALAHYRFMYFHDTGPAGWQRIDLQDRSMFLRRYLLQPKPLPRIATPQYGFVDAVGFSDVPLPALDG
jgi:FkbM family methyltransferase